MSQVTDLKRTLESIAQDTRKTSGALAQFRERFTRSAAAVTAAIDGTAQKKDKEVIASLDEAKTRVAAAVQALEKAAKTAQNYGRSI